MKRSQRWFTNNSQQNTRLLAATMPVLNVTGPRSQAETIRTENSKGEKFFLVGKTKVGGDEVIG